MTNKDEIKEYLKENLSIKITEGPECEFGNSKEVIFTLELEGEKICSDNMFISDELLY